jgi:hypothetical protein
MTNDSKWSVSAMTDEPARSGKFPWSDKFQSKLETVGKKLEDNWITENAKSADEDTERMLRKAFRHGFYSGAGCSHKLREI